MYWKDGEVMRLRWDAVWSLAKKAGYNTPDTFLLQQKGIMMADISYNKLLDEYLMSDEVTKEGKTLKPSVTPFGYFQRGLIISSHFSCFCILYQRNPFIVSFDSYSAYFCSCFII
jgi:hypothetical protein